jgi:hypothetical protein
MTPTFTKTGDVEVLLELTCRRLEKVVDYPVTYNYVVDFDAGSLHVEFLRRMIENPSRQVNAFAEFKLSGFPGNTSFLVSTDQWVSHEYRNRRIGSVLTALKECLATAWGVRYLIATVNNGNDHELKLLANLDWTLVDLPDMPVKLAYHSVNRTTITI